MKNKIEVELIGPKREVWIGMDYYNSDTSFQSLSEEESKEAAEKSRDENIELMEDTEGQEVVCINGHHAVWMYGNDYKEVTEY